MPARKKPAARRRAPPAPPAIPLWPADQVERRPIASLIPYARNARTHSKGQIAQIAASMKEFGWTIPVLVDEASVLIAGHGRVLAAPLLGWAEAPVMVARGWTDAQKKAYRLADNKLSLNSGWDTDLLIVEMQEVRGLGVDAELMGFTPREIEKLDATQNGLDPQTMQQAFDVLVECSDEQQQRALLTRLDGEGYKCRSLLR